MARMSQFPFRNKPQVPGILAALVLLSPTPALAQARDYLASAVEPVAFKHAGVIDTWSAYAGKLTFGKGQTLALLDDGCKLSMPEWSQSEGAKPKVLVSYDSVDGDDDPKHEGRGYHGSTIGIPSSLNYKGKLGVAFNNQLAVVRALECCHCNVKDSKTLAAGLQWVIDHHAKYRVTAVNLAPVDDLEHATPVPTEIDAKLKRLRELGIWVSAPTGNHNFTKGISWPACQPHCFAIGAVRPGKDEVYLDRSAKIDLVVPAAATSSSNAILCGAVLLVREAIEKSGYAWKNDGTNLPEAMMAIFQRTGVAVRDPGSNQTFRRLDLKAALDEVFKHGKSAEEASAVSTSRRVHPVLIRNEFGPLLQIVVAAPPKKDVRLQALHFSLDGADAVGDLESLSLFSTGDKHEFATTTPVGKPMDPAKQVVFHGDLTLRPGKNVFWLSCRLKPTADLSHHVRAVCTSVETTLGKLPAQDLTPAVRQRIGVALRRHNDDGVHTYRIPALTTTPKGTLLCVYDMRRRMGRDLQEDIDIGLSRSSDGGQTWEPVRVIMDMGKYGGLPEEQNGCSDPGIIVDRQTGEIFCFAVWMHGNPGKHQWTGDGSAPGYEIGKAAQILMVSSKDDGRTWTKPVNLTRTLKKAEWWLLAPSPQAGINLPDGTLIMPTQGRDEKGVPFACIMVSKDHGKTWTVSASAYSGGNECQAVQLGDGSIMLNMRNDHDRFRAIFVTKDLGTTWQPHETNRKALIEPNCNGSLLRVDYLDAGVKKHALLFSNPHTQKGRTHQTIQVSFDDGRTWPASHHLLLDEGRGAGYPSLTRVDERHVGIVYEGSQAQLVFEKIPLAELLKPLSN